MKKALLVIALVSVSACASGITLDKIKTEVDKLPPITVVVKEPPLHLDRPKPTETAPVVEPAPVAAPVVETPSTPEPVVDVRPFQKLNVRVFNVRREPIAGARVSIAAEHRTTDGSGFVNFGVQGPQVATVTADKCDRQIRDVPPGDHEFTLFCQVPGPFAAIVPAPEPAPPSAPMKTSGVIAACMRAHNTNRISDGCLEAVSRNRPLDYTACSNGDGVACHRYVRAVARALRTSTGDDGWGLLSKPVGQMACSLTACGRDISGGYGEDMVTYLPKGHPVNRWTGLDIIIGAGAKGAKYGGGVLPEAVGGRPDNLWAPVPLP